MDIGAFLPVSPVGLIHRSDAHALVFSARVNSRVDTRQSIAVLNFSGFIIYNS